LGVLLRVLLGRRRRRSRRQCLDRGNRPRFYLDRGQRFGLARDLLHRRWRNVDGTRGQRDISSAEGTIDRPRDVDVFRFAGKKGQKLSAEVLAHRYGSPLDAMLTLYNATFQQVAFNDDLAPDTRDARLAVVLPADGEYYLALIDAHDAGSAAHVYRLVVK